MFKFGCRLILPLRFHEIVQLCFAITMAAVNSVKCHNEIHKFCNGWQKNVAFSFFKKSTKQFISPSMFQSSLLVATPTASMLLLTYMHYNSNRSYWSKSYTSQRLANFFIVVTHTSILSACSIGNRHTMCCLFVNV